MHTACGIVGVVSTHQTLDIQDLLDAMYAIQHRGCHSWGAASLEGGQLLAQVQPGLLPDRRTLLKPRAIRHALGHVGHSGVMATNTGAAVPSPTVLGCQPVLVNSARGKFALAFNGRLGHLRMCDPSDTETHDVYRIAAGIAQHPSSNWVEALHDAAASCVAAFAITVLTDEGLFYARDIRGYRPIMMADISAWSGSKTGAGAGTGAVTPLWKVVVVASEATAYETLFKNLVKRHPGLILRLKPRAITAGSVGQVRLDGSWTEWEIKCKYRDAPGGLNRTPLQRCALEAVHFMRGGGQFDELDIDYFREECGRALAKQDRDSERGEGRNGRKGGGERGECGFDIATTLVVGCPRGGIAAGRGYAAAACLPYAQVLRATAGVLRTRPGAASADSGRPKQVVRRRKERPTLVVDGTVTGKHVVLVDDLMVRADTMKRAVALLREAGAARIHVRIGAPMVQNTCVWGTKLPDVEDLFAANTPPSPGRLDADSLEYLSTPCFERLIGAGFCQGCFFRQGQTVQV